MSDNEIPAEIWAIWHPFGHLVPFVDNDGTDDGFMAWPTRDEAERSLRYYLKNGYITGGEVVRIK